MWLARLPTPAAPEPPLVGLPYRLIDLYDLDTVDILHGDYEGTVH